MPEDRLFLRIDIEKETILLIFSLVPGDTSVKGFACIRARTFIIKFRIVVYSFSCSAVAYLYPLGCYSLNRISVSGLGEDSYAKVANDCMKL